MNRDQFKSFLEDLHDQELMLNSTKGKEYAAETDVLADFRAVAEVLGWPVRQVVLTYMMKHWRAICFYAKNGHLVSNETLVGRVNDLRLYLALLRVAQIEEEEWVRDAIEADGANF